MGWQGTQVQAANDQSAAVEPIWQRLFRKSIFQFASPDLEGGYQMYLSKHAGEYLLAFVPMFTIGWLQTLSCVAVSGYRGGFNAPPGFLHSVALFLTPVVLLMAFYFLHPKAYAQHWRGINVAFMMVHVFSTNSFQMLCMWQQACIAKGICCFGERFSANWFQTSATENAFLCIICLHLFKFSAGQAPDILFSTPGLVLSLASNKSLCESPLWGPERVTLSAPLVSVPQKGSAFLLALLVPDSIAGLWLPKTDRLSCPAVLGFWQVVGWCLACLLIVGREIVSRRAYLKTAGPHFGPQFSERAAAWPFGNAEMMHKTLCAVFSVCIGSSLI